VNILCLTPVDHVHGVRAKLSSLGKLVYAPLETNVLLIKDMIVSNGISVLYINPNKQRYVIGDNLLDGTSVQIIVTVSRGTNHIDMDYCEQNSIGVIHLNRDPVVARNSATAEHALALTLALLKKLPQAYDSVKNGEWDYSPFIGHQLSSLTVGVIGMGSLGSMYASYCRAIGSVVLECTSQTSGSFENVMSCSDVISLHIPLTEQNYHFVDVLAIKKVKGGGAFIINTSRGEIVDEEAIVNGLRSGQIKGYATDVLSNEKEDISNNVIVKAQKEGLNIIITPHIAGTCFESAEVAHFRAIELLERQK